MTMDFEGGGSKAIRYVVYLLYIDCEKPLARLVRTRLKIASGKTGRMKTMGETSFDLCFPFSTRAW